MLKRGSRKYVNVSIANAVRPATPMMTCEPPVYGWIEKRGREKIATFSDHGDNSEVVALKVQAWIL